MQIPKSMRWLVALGMVLLALGTLSFFALDRPDVVWREGVARCPQCRAAVPAYASRCATCREAFDWVPAGEEDSPYCTHCLTPDEDDALRARRMKLGEDVAADRIAHSLGIAPAAAKAYLLAAGRGQCGWCGGTGRDVAATQEKAECPACAGTGRCAGCDGDRRVRIGIEAAAIELTRYRALTSTWSGSFTPVDVARAHVGVENRAFLRRYAGTSEAAELYFAPMFRSGANARDLPRGAPLARSRLDRVLADLAAE